MKRSSQSTKLFLFSLVLVAALAVGVDAKAARGISVTQSNLVETVSTDAPVVPFDVQNEDSVLVVSIYSEGWDMGNFRFGDGGGIGSGDVAPEQVVPSPTGYDRERLLYFLNPPTNSGLAVRWDKSDAKAHLVALWELAGVDLAATVASGTTNITTDKANEFIIGTCCRNGDYAPRPSASSILQLDIHQDSMGGGGCLAGGIAMAASPGTYDTTWVGEGGIGEAVTFSFEPIYPPAGTVIVIR